jgi:SAM-dependent methyltransferase
MPDTAVAGPNAEQVRYWNETAGPKWVALAPVLDAHIAPFGARAVERSGARAGERALDVGCGCGDTTLALARRVAPGGTVVGIDVSAPMLARARERAAEAALAGLRFVEADAQTHPFPPASFDLVFSRFGVMFFADPPAAFRNLRTALRPGGRLAFVCWQGLAENPWLRVPLQAVARHVALPPPPPPEAPGPLALADANRVRAVLAAAGFADVAVDPLRETLVIAGGDLEPATEFLLAVGPASAALRAAGVDAGPEVRRTVRDALAPFATDGRVRMPAAAWIVTGRRPPA